MDKLNTVLADMVATSDAAPAVGGADAADEAGRVGEGAAEAPAPAAVGGAEVRSTIPVVEIISVDDDPADGGVPSRGSTQSEVVNIAQMEAGPAVAADGGEGEETPTGAIGAGRTREMMLGPQRITIRIPEAET
eukprot:9534009-Alexandrium_andersonii.AAC.1